MNKKRKIDRFKRYVADLNTDDHALCSVEIKDAAAFVFLTRPECKRCGKLAEPQRSEGIVVAASDKDVDGRNVFIVSV